MNALLLTLAITTTVGSLLAFQPAAAQLLPPAKKAERVEITKAPALEWATDHLTIIMWTTNNPGGSDLHYSIAHYATDPKSLRQTTTYTTTPNSRHQNTTFRARIYRPNPP